MQIVATAHYFALLALRRDAPHTVEGAHGQCPHEFIDVCVVWTVRARAQQTKQKQQNNNDQVNLFSFGLVCALCIIFFIFSLRFLLLLLFRRRSRRPQSGAIRVVVFLCAYFSTFSLIIMKRKKKMFAKWFRGNLCRLQTI